MTKQTRKTPLEKQLDKQRDHIANAIFTAGSQKALAAQLGVSQAAISKWLLRGWVPLPRAIEIEALVGVPRTAIADPRVVGMLATTDSMLPAVA